LRTRLKKLQLTKGFAAIVAGLNVSIFAWPLFDSLKCGYKFEFYDNDQIVEQTQNGM
jgi:hypothetical protein